MLDTQSALAQEPKSASAAASSSAAAAAAAAAAASGSSAAAAAAERAAAGGAAGGASDRAGLRSVGKTNLGFEVVSVAFNPVAEQELLVVGLKEMVALTPSHTLSHPLIPSHSFSHLRCPTPAPSKVALTLGARGEVVSRISVELLLDQVRHARPHLPISPHISP